MNKIVYLHESELTKLKGLIANGEKNIVFECRGEEPITVGLGVGSGTFRVDIADVIMYALDNGNHNIHISFYDKSTYINIEPVKEEEEVEPEEEPEDVRNCNNCKHQGSARGWIPIDITSSPSPCYSCVIPFNGRNVPSQWEPKETSDE